MFSEKMREKGRKISVICDGNGDLAIEISLYNLSDIYHNR